jgi:tetratricopeptide (TPR) repeat protein
VLLGLGKSQLALQVLETGLDSTRSHGWLLAALAHAHLGQFQEALVALKHQRQSIAPRTSLLLNHLLEALILASQGETEEALLSLNTSGLLNTTFGSLHAIAATVLALAGDKTQARALVSQAHRLEPRQLGLTSLWALATLNLGDKAGAEHFFRLATAHGCAAEFYLRDSAFLNSLKQDPVMKSFLNQISSRARSQSETLIAMVP